MGARARERWALALAFLWSAAGCASVNGSNPEDTGVADTGASTDGGAAGPVDAGVMDATLFDTASERGSASADTGPGGSHVDSETEGEAATDAHGMIDATVDGAPGDSPTDATGEWTTTFADAGDAGTAACEHYYRATYTRCDGPVVPASEAARVQGRFVQVCENDMALPGSGMSPANVEACASALDQWPCVNGGPPQACSFYGSLGGGAACNEDLQCQSGWCQGTAAFTPAGQQGPYTCGTCVPAVGVGQTCGSAGCFAGAICLNTDPSAPQSTYVCTAITQGAAGASCDGLAALCQPGLTCAHETCAAVLDAGAACGQGPGDQACAPPLDCSGAAAASSCAAGAAGATCTGDFDCASGLGCVPGPCTPQGGMGGCSPTGTCTSPIDWVDAGQTCDGFQSRCLVGSCQCTSGPECILGMPVGSVDGGLGQGTCPPVVADGQPCTVGGLFGTGPTCDTLAQCFSPTGPAGMTGPMGTCTLLDSVVCR